MWFWTIPLSFPFSVQQLKKGKLKGNGTKPHSEFKLLNVFVDLFFRVQRCYHAKARHPSFITLEYEKKHTYQFPALASNFQVTIFEESQL